MTTNRQKEKQKLIRLGYFYGFMLKIGLPVLYIGFIILVLTTI